MMRLVVVPRVGRQLFYDSKIVIITVILYKGRRTENGAETNVYRHTNRITFACGLESGVCENRC